MPPAVRELVPLCYSLFTPMSHPTKPTTRKHSFLGSVLSGMALPATVGDRHTFRRLEGSDLERIRGDVVTVGRTFSTVITREHGHQKASVRPGERTATR